MKKNVQHNSNSLKTFYLYATVVFVLIIISLTVKAIFILQQSRVDPAHEFILAVIQQRHVKEIVAFHPETPTLSILLIQDSAVSYDMLAKIYGITTDGYIETNGEPQGADLTAFLWQSLLHTGTGESNLTILDKIRLMLLAKNVVTNNKTSQQLFLTKQTSDTNTMISTALTDQELASENISIEVVNATGVSGLGQRLGKVLTNLGANVVDVTSAAKEQPRTTLAYFGDESYTTDRLQKFLGISASKLSKQTI